MTLFRHSFVHLYTFVTCNLCEIALRACVSLVWGYSVLFFFLFFFGRRLLVRYLSFRFHSIHVGLSLSTSVTLWPRAARTSEYRISGNVNKRARQSITIEYRTFFVCCCCCCCTILILMRALASSPLALFFHLGESHKMYIIGWMLSRAAFLPLYRETHISSYCPLNGSTHIKASKRKKNK